MESLSHLLRALGDPTRLRILRLVCQAPLNVSELVSLVGLAQSSVSHHLAKLKDLKVIREERQATFTYHALAVTSSDPLWPVVRLAREGPDEYGDQARLAELLRRREDRASLNERLLEPGQSWMLWAGALSALLPRLDVADFGCGTGVLTVEIARWARRVTAVDRSPEALKQAALRGKRERRRNISFLAADLHSLPIAAESKDLVVASQSLHHVEDPGAVLAQAGRIVKPGGRLIVLELMPHQETWVRERLGHAHMGFEPRVLARAATRAGFRALRVTPSPRDGNAPFRAFLLSGVRK